jgi:hexosaminidase
MLDVSRDRVPTRETLTWLVDILAELHFNELQLYVEHAFAYADHEVVWAHASPLTPADLTWLADLAAGNGIELVANMNGFGHMGRWLQHREYRHLAECPNGAPGLFGPEPVDPTCLEPTAANAAFAVDLAREMLRSVGSTRVHIGGDEPFELGEGRSAERVGEMGRDRIYMDHLLQIIEPLGADGYEVLFWADLFRRDPTLLGEIPAFARGVVWNYEAPSAAGWMDWIPADLANRLGLPDDANLGFIAHARLFIESGTPFWVAPGTGTWNTIIGRNGNAAANIVDAATVGLTHGAEGFLLTDWGDNGHSQPLVVSLPSLVRGAVAAWTGKADPIDVGPVIDELLNADSGTGHTIDSLGHLGESLGMMTPNGSPIFAELSDIGLPNVGTPDRAGLAAALAEVRGAADGFAANPIRGDRGEVISVEMCAAIGLAELGIRRLSGDEPSAAEFEAAIAAQAEAWLASSRPGGLDDSIAKLRRPGAA